MPPLLELPLCDGCYDREGPRERPSTKWCKPPYSGPLLSFQAHNYVQVRLMKQVKANEAAAAAAGRQQLRPKVFLLCFWQVRLT
jgi:hypothetical protein